MQKRLLISFTFILLFTSCQHSYRHQIETHQVIVIDNSIAEDSNIVALIQPYRDSLGTVMNEVIGYNSKTIRSHRPESLLSSFTADLLHTAGENFLTTQNTPTHPAVSIMNIRGLRAPLPKGPVTIRNIYEVMPFENNLYALLMDGDQMRDLFNHIASINGDGISGASFTMTDSTASNILINDQPLHTDSLYWVITSDYLASGGDHYHMFGKSEKILVSSKKIRELIIEHIRELTAQNLEIVADPKVRIHTKK